MTRLFLMLDKIKDVKMFFETTQQIPCKVYLQQNEYIVDAHSLMGIFSLDLSKVVTFMAEDKVDDAIMEQLKEFSVDK